MTKQEAIDRLKPLKRTNVEFQDGTVDVEDTHRLRGAIRIAIECIEMQIPRKPVVKLGLKRCPTCSGDWIIVEDGQRLDYCPLCSQAIDWGDDE